MPLEKASRWPRLVSCRGMKASSAWKLASRGKSAKLVLAASTRISSVNSWKMKNCGPLPTTPLAICEMTVVSVVRHGAHVAGQPRQAEEHDAEERAHHHEGRAGVLPLRRLEGGHAVRDGLDAGHGRAARGEGVEQEEQRRRCRWRPGSPGRRRDGQVPEAASHEADDDDGQHRHDEAVGRRGEELPRLLDAPQVPPARSGR